MIHLPYLFQTFVPFVNTGAEVSVSVSFSASDIQ
jgi:hypothetical protein